MAQGKFAELSVAQRTEVWRRWKAGESLHRIGRAFDCPFPDRVLVVGGSEMAISTIYKSRRTAAKIAGLAFPISFRHRGCRQFRHIRPPGRRWQSGGKRSEYPGARNTIPNRRRRRHGLLRWHCHTADSTLRDPQASRLEPCPVRGIR